MSKWEKEWRAAQAAEKAARDAYQVTKGALGDLAPWEVDRARREWTEAAERTNAVIRNHGRR